MTNKTWTCCHNPLYFQFAFVLTALFCFGCADPNAAITTNMHEDFDHDHKHQHTGEDDHEHQHNDGFRGSHSHGHSHSHRHGEPLHGGCIVSIGHTHHKDGATHFHAEVMPLSNNVIHFHLLTESDEGKSQDYPIEDDEISALISIKGEEAGGSEHSFVAVGDGDNASEFTLTVPDDMADGEAFSVVIPRVKLGGHRQNFSFTVTRKAAESNASSSETNEAPSDKAQEASDE